MDEKLVQQIKKFYSKIPTRYVGWICCLWPEQKLIRIVSFNVVGYEATFYCSDLLLPPPLAEVWGIWMMCVNTYFTNGRSGLWMTGLTGPDAAGVRGMRLRVFYSILSLTGIWHWPGRESTVSEPAAAQSSEQVVERTESGVAFSVSALCLRLGAGRSRRLRSRACDN
jgi:hypothetical protein